MEPSHRPSPAAWIARASDHRQARSWSFRILSRRGSLPRLGSALGILVVAASLSSVGVASGAPGGTSRAVIVQARAGREAAVGRMVVHLGGTIREPLAIIHGFTADVPGARIALLRRDHDVLGVTPDAAIQSMGSSYGPALGSLGASYNPGSDVNSMPSTASYLGATRWWDAGYTGLGIDVALIDSGVSPVKGLSASGKVFYGPDLSLESQDPSLHNLDSYGHGTFMGALIAGHDDGLTKPYSQAPATRYRGMAPDARLISIKVATADGGTDVSQIIAAIDWVVQHRSDPGFNIRVINLSYGTNSLQPYALDPLAFAAETAWKAGIVVVAAAGNSGYQKDVGAPGMADPAYDPFVMATGASSSNGTSSTTDDTVGSFSASGCGLLCRDPDAVAPGTSIQGLRDPGSYIDTQFPGGRLGDRYFRGSGTSEAAAVMSGAVALVLQKYPTLTPDQVKRFFTDNAFQLSGFDHSAQGAGEISLGAMIGHAPRASSQHAVPATGLGVLELSRGQDHLSANGVELSAEIDIFGSPFTSRVMALLETLGISWKGGVWNANVWAGDGWSGNSWLGVTWSGTDWSGKSWSSGTWSSKSWSGSGWSSGDWSSKSWSGGYWSGKSWSSASWG